MNALFNLLLVIVFFGVVVGLINRFIPMPPLIKSLLNLVVFVVLVIYILQFFGIIAPVFPTVEWIAIKEHS